MHQISLVAHYKLKSDEEMKPLTVESNVIELTTEQYRSFSFYSFFSQMTRSVASLTIPYDLCVHKGEAKGDRP